jgi:Asp/Glu/Hydantoin racemase
MGEDAPKMVGLIGGLGPESTIDYYRRIIQVWQQHRPQTSPSILIDSLDVQRGLALVANDRAGLADYLFASVRRLAKAGADFIALTANTAHIVYDELAARSPLPMLSIVEVCAQEAERRGLKRLGLLGTRFTMEAAFYPTVFSRYGIEVVAPVEAERRALEGRLPRPDAGVDDRADRPAARRGGRRGNHPRRHRAAAAPAGAHHCRAACIGHDGTARGGDRGAARIGRGRIARGPTFGRIAGFPYCWIGAAEAGAFLTPGSLTFNPEEASLPAGVDGHAARSTVGPSLATLSRFHTSIPQRRGAAITGSAWPGGCP